MQASNYYPYRECFQEGFALERASFIGKVTRLDSEGCQEENGVYLLSRRE